MVPCPPVRPSVCLSQGQRERQQESREAAGDAHRPLRMTHKSRKFQSESREVRHSCCDLFCCFFVDMLSSTTLVRGKNNVALRLIFFFFQLCELCDGATEKFFAVYGAPTTGPPRWLSLATPILSSMECCFPRYPQAVWPRHTPGHARSQLLTLHFAR